MTAAQSRRRGRFLGLVGMSTALAVGLLTSASPDRATAAPRAQKDDKKEYPRPTAEDVKAIGLIGAAECKVCHNEKDPKEQEIYQQTLGFEFIRLWENKVWSVHDLHSTAYKNLLTDRTVKGNKDVPNKTAQTMEDNLRKYKGENYTVATDTGCLACHASMNRPVHITRPEQWTAKSFTTIDGVGCEMCHGHGSLYKERHRSPGPVMDEKNDFGAVRVVDWREADPKTKAEWGLVNLRNPAVAAEQCASCHIGNVKEGRFVTHDWYAAGHPPLPPLDLLAFTREQPRHWGLPSEMPYLRYLADKHGDKALAVFHIRAGESHVARRFVESTVATLKASAALGAQLANTEQSKTEGLDYAAFDCASCHHNLKYPSDRQDRGYLGKPGRPLFRPATFALTKVVIAHAAGMEGGAGFKASYDALLAAEKKLADAFTDKSLGDPDKVKVAAKEVSDWCDEALKKLTAVRYTPKATQELLSRLTEAAKQEPKDKDPTKRAVADPEVAQLFSWAVETLLLDLIPSPGKADNDQPKPPAEVEALRKSLDGIVVTRLRPKAPFHYEVPGGVPGPTLEAVDTRIGDRMKIFNSFQGKPFRDAFANLKPAFPK